LRPLEGLDSVAAMTLRLRAGDATAPEGEGPKIIVHVCNDVGGWGKGFVLALSRRWAAPEEHYRAWHRERANNDFRLGAVQLVPVDEGLWVANLIGQRDVRAAKGVPPVRFEAIEEGLGTLAERAAELGASVHMPRIGCGLAGGSWDEMEPLIRRTLVARGIAVTVYDLPPR
jgi:O-acetyl-ADP-ribose deacetylase (regulator of RNase III)